MTHRSVPIVHRIQRATDGLFDALGARPLGLVVFAGSLGLLLALQGRAAGGTRAQAVAIAQVVEHPAGATSFVTAVFVKPGDAVAVDQPIASLSPRFVEQQIERLDARVEELEGAAALALAELVVEEQRWVAPGMRVNPRRPSLERPTKALFDSQLEGLAARRAQLVASLESLEVLGQFEGRVSRVLALGQSVEAGASVATVVPEHADEIVAYLPPGTDPDAIAGGTPVSIAAAGSPACQGPSQVLRRGAAVEQAPDQLRSLFRTPLHGLPVHVSVPTGCRLGVGQVIAVDLHAGLG